MNGTLVIARKEFRQLFASPIAYVALAMFFLITGFLFFSLIGLYTTQVLQLQGTPPADFNPTRIIFSPLFQDVSFVLILLVPVLTSQEQNQRHLGIDCGFAVSGGAFLEVAEPLLLVAA